MTVRLRMAPSPTGDYHIGHIRTLLYNYAFVRKQHGKFIIRVEDTDRERYVDGAVDRILDVIEDYGLNWDEGPRVGGDFGPYIQSDRLDIYKKHASELIEKGTAYYCFCTKERLAKIREAQQAKGVPSTKYDKHCLDLSKEEVQKKLDGGESYVIRLNVPKDEEISFEDEVYGKVVINSNDLDDQILLKSDGFPTYHLGVVVDDHLMKITHIMRGNDWLPSTPKHILLYKAFGWKLPIYVHLPNLKELEGTKKLSKRFGSVFARDFLKEGYLAEALLNFLMFLGWNPGTEKELFTLKEFIKDFSIKRVQKTDLVSFDRKKLLWLNGQYIRELKTKELWKKIETWAEKFGVDLVGSGFENDYIVKVLGLAQERMKVLSEFNELTSYFFEDPSVDGKLFVKFSGGRDRSLEILESFETAFSDVDDKKWNKSHLEKICDTVLSENNYTPKEAYMTLRVVLTGKKASPHIFDVLEVLGREVVARRISVQTSS